MAKFLFATLFASISLFGEVSTMKEIHEYVEDFTAKDLVIFDIDGVLLQGTEASFQMGSLKAHRHIAKEILKDFSADQKYRLLNLMVISSGSTPVDEGALPLFQDLRERNIRAMALTAGMTGPLAHVPNMERWKLGRLQGAGIDFSKTAPRKEPLTFSALPTYNGNHTVFLEGILFVNGPNVSKGDALTAFLPTLSELPERIVFVDDRKGNLESVSTALKEHYPQIAYRGFHFVKESGEIAPPEEFRAKWSELAEKVR